MKVCNSRIVNFELAAWERLVSREDLYVRVVFILSRHCATPSPSTPPTPNQHKQPLKPPNPPTQTTNKTTNTHTMPSNAQLNSAGIHVLCVCGKEVKSFYGCAAGRRCKYCDNDYHVNAKHKDEYRCAGCLRRQQNEEKMKTKAAAAENEALAKGEVGGGGA